MSGNNELRVGVDVGGTFTDIVAFSPKSDDFRITKTPSTPSNPEDGVIDGLRQLFEETGYGPDDVTSLSHGSTVTLNTLIEHTGAHTAMLHTEGFDAIPVARRGNRPLAEVKNPRYSAPEAYIPQRFVYGIPERVDSAGNVIEPLAEDAAKQTIQHLKEVGVESIGVCFLFSFLNPSHECRVRELIQEIHPDCSVSLSSEVSPRIREYPRFSTTATNAYVARKLNHYLSRLKERLDDEGINSDELTMMLSHGGVTRFEDVPRRPIQTVLSGPAAGVQGGLFAADLADAKNVVTIDMGGTSCDISIATDGVPLTTTDAEIDGHPVSVPMVDIQTIGAGGGTIARVEEDRLRVGPESAGADPGPVCYGQDGRDITVTDANAVLGRLSPDTTLAGGLSLDVDAAERAMEAQIADPLGLSVHEAAAGIFDVVNAKMEKELSVSLIQKGYDPREFTLLPYGGAGPMHASAIAQDLSIGQLVVPAWPGVNSAVGLLTSNRKAIYETSRIDRLTEAPLETTFDELRRTAYEDLRRADVDAGDATYEQEIEIRYSKEPYELEIPFSEGESAQTLRERFSTVHRDTYGHTSEKSLETMTYRVTIQLETDKPTGETIGDVMTDETDEWRGVPTRSVYFDGSFVDTPIYQRRAIPAGGTFEGPAIIEQVDTTIVVNPEMAATVDGYGNVLLSNEAV